MKFFLSVCLFLIQYTSVFGSYKSDIVGEYENYHVNVISHAQSKNEENNLIKKDLISFKDATFISVHFSKFNLPDGDFVIVRSPDHEQSHKYTGLGRDSLGLSSKGFFASYIAGTTAIVEYYSSRTTRSLRQSHESYGYTIDKFSHGFESIPKPNLRESICGSDGSHPVKCFKKKYYEQSLAVVRLLVKGKFFCTGWLVGCQGHLMTNEHCIGSQYDASNTDFEFEAESSSCEEQCKVALGCRGKMKATTSKLLSYDSTLDYALVKLDTTEDLNRKYGYYQLRNGRPIIGENIFIPQHPEGWAKRISAHLDDGSLAKISSLNAVNSCGSNQVGYMADTQGGSSGSPVIALKDNLVIALHHCGGCHNTGHEIIKIIKHIKKNGVSIPKCALPDSNSKPTDPIKEPTKPSINCSYHWFWGCEPSDACIWSRSQQKCVPY